MNKFLLIFLSYTCWTQNQLDTLKLDAESFCKESGSKLFCKSYTHYLNKQYDSCYIYSSKALSNESLEKKRNILFYIQSVSALRKGLNNKALINLKNMNSYLSLKRMKLGRVYLGLKEYDSAIFYYERWLKLNKKDKSNHIKAVYHNLGLSFLHKKEYITAKDYFSKELKFVDNQDTLNLISTKMDLANVYYNQYLDNEAIPLFTEAYELAKLYSNLKWKELTTKNMAVVEKNRKNYEESVKYYEEYDKLKDSIWNRDNIIGLAERDKQIAIAQKQQEIVLQEEQLKRQKLVQNGLLVGASGLVVFIGFLGFLYKKLKKQNELITQQKEDLNVANKTKDYLFSVVSHDLRSPMNTIRSQHIALQSHIENKDLEAIQKTNEAAIAVTESTSHLLNNVLHWSLEQSNQLLFDTKEYALRPLVQHVLHDYTTLIEAKGITISGELENVLVKVDKESLKIVLRNLLDNAVKYMNTLGDILVKTGIHSNTEAFIQVIDSGIGIPEDKLQKINALKDLTIDKIDRSKGVGLGLLLCQTLVKKNNGSITFESEVGKGTTITIVLPSIED